jgi:hypothetical protein
MFWPDTNCQRLVMYTSKEAALYNLPFGYILNKGTIIPKTFPNIESAFSSFEVESRIFISRASWDRQGSRRRLILQCDFGPLRLVETRLIPQNYFLQWSESINPPKGTTV